MGIRTCVSLEFLRGTGVDWDLSDDVWVHCVEPGIIFGDVGGDDGDLGFICVRLIIFL